MKRGTEEFEKLSTMMLVGVRQVMDVMTTKPGLPGMSQDGLWNGWTTSGMRMLTDALLEQLLKELEKKDESGRGTI